MLAPLSERKLSERYKHLVHTKGEKPEDVFDAGDQDPDDSTEERSEEGIIENFIKEGRSEVLNLEVKGQFNSS